MSKDETLIQSVMDDKWTVVQEGIERVVAKKLFNRIQDKKTEILAGLNHTTKEKMAEVLKIKQAA